MEHFVAYHSAQRMGYEFEASGEFRFFSRKLGLLKKALGNMVWVIQGVPDGKKTAFSLCGTYVAEQIGIEDPSSDLYVISGHRVKQFVPYLRLNNLEWFSALLKSQSNFSLGFNRINDEIVIKALSALQAEGSTPLPSALLDLDIPTSGTEGTARLVTHLCRERNRAIVEAKKATILKVKGHLCCEVCNFDFSATYGALGEGFCEVHHLVPLSASSDSVATTLDDLAILCSNCHRIIHRADPMLSVSQLSEVVRNGHS